MDFRLSRRRQQKAPTYLLIYNWGRAVLKSQSFHLCVDICEKSVEVAKKRYSDGGKIHRDVNPAGKLARFLKGYEPKRYNLFGIEHILD